MRSGIRVIVALGLVCVASTVRAQTPNSSSPEAGQVFLNVSGSSQLQSRTFSNSATFSSFGETGISGSSQNIGRGGVFDVTGGYRFARHMGVAAGLWMANSDSAAAATVLIPNPVLFNQFKTLTISSSDSGTALNQRDIGLNIQFMWTMAIASRTDLSLFVGPTIVRVRQDVATLAVSPSAQTATMSIDRESASTSKAGNAGVDVTYRFTARFGLGVFVRYTGGEVDLPAVSKLKVGGVQAGGGLRIRF